MASGILRNLHVPLGEPLHRRLTAEALRAKRPATELARQAIREWLDSAERAAVHDAIARYAAGHAGGPADLDVELEAGAIEHLLARPRKRRR